MFSATDIERIKSATFVADVEHHREIGSTNDRALVLAADAERAAPLLVVADRQTGGRGRGANRWWAGDGALTFSLLLEAAAWGLAPDRWPRISLTAGLAVCEALLDLLPGADAGLKWPNDVFLSGRKVCGILIEIPPGQSGRMVVGIGVNVNNSFAAAPGELKSIGVALCDAAGYRFSLADVLIGVLRRLDARLQSLTDDDDLSQRWRTFCILHGRSVSILSGSRRLAGVCQGIDHDGALLLATPRGEERCYAGVVERIE